MNKRLQWFPYINGFVLIGVGLLMLIPFLNILAGSFSSGQAILQGKVTIFPVNFTLDNYASVLRNAAIWQSFGITVWVTVAGTLVSLLFTAMMGYGLSKEQLRGRAVIMILIIITIVFPAPLIPTYLLIKSLGMLNSLNALIIPGLISAFNLIIMISFFRNIPEGLTEAATIDGCSEFKIFRVIVLPLSLPSLMTIGLFYAVGYWNGYMNAIMYLRDPDLYTLQVKLRQLIVESDAGSMVQGMQLSVEGIKMATIIVATVPVLLIYPMIQKHFIKGALLGSVKG
ncbi:MULTISPECIES: carbohydrate ABC transporter permease [Paenibacillus]|jgi:putative aldouronate transport system permease protein|uniref:Carbohydrate ABC transporter permease n=1 Tax=Paenibacillus baimaensis TaxID=2982185 RepID=A0ABT2UM49_9BACL|nr:MULTISPECIES: carbohydrate ABC transporter permease [Paenibacillus]MCU6795723.1 carbohydrate ABC transporter permease [Paenibacillus sp. WQ 127069]